MIIENRNGDVISPNISKMGILDVSTKDFRLNESDGGFLIKNETSSPILLRVRLLSMSNIEDTVETLFFPGWGNELVKFVECNSSVNKDSLKYGY